MNRSRIHFPNKSKNIDVNCNTNGYELFIIVPKKNETSVCFFLEGIPWTKSLLRLGDRRRLAAAAGRHLVDVLDQVGRELAQVLHSVIPKRYTSWWRVVGPVPRQQAVFHDATEDAAPSCTVRLSGYFGKCWYSSNRLRSIKSKIFKSDFFNFMSISQHEFTGIGRSQRIDVIKTNEGKTFHTRCHFKDRFRELSLENNAKLLKYFDENLILKTCKFTQ